MVDGTFLKMVQEILECYKRRYYDESFSLGYLPEQLAKGDALICWRNNYSGHLTASALLVNKIDSKVLLVRHKFLDRWLQPGGHVDGFEHPKDAALRELLEETGISATESILAELPIDIDSHEIPRNSKKRELSHYHHDFLYIFTCDAIDVNPELSELAEARWFSLESLLDGKFGNRLARAVRKLQSMQPDLCVSLV